MKPILIYKSGIHLGEEKLVQGNSASGVIYFSGCHLACNFCYTPETSKEARGGVYSQEQFAARLDELMAQGARNVNLVSPTHLWPAIESPLAQWRARHVGTPLVLKVSGFETPNVLSRMQQLADVFVPDFKVFASEAAVRVALPSAYGAMAQRAIAQVMRTHAAVFSANGELTRGILVRHLMMPGFLDDSRRVIEALGEIGYRQTLNLMTHFLDLPNRRSVTAIAEDVAQLVREAQALGMQVLVNGVPCEAVHAEVAHGG